MITDLGNYRIADLHGAFRDAMDQGLGFCPKTPHPVAEFGIARIAEEIGQRTVNNRPGAPRDKRSLIKAALTTSDFGSLLTDIVKKVAQQAATSEGSLDHRRLAREVELKDYRPTRLGSLIPDELSPVDEEGEYGLTDIATFDGQDIQLRRYGRRVTVSPEVIANEDFGAIFSAIAGIVASYSRLELRDMAKLLAANPVLSDGVELFSPTVGNNLTVGEPGTADAFRAGVAALRLQAARTGQEPLNLAPRFLLIHPQHEVNVREMLANLGFDAEVVVHWGIPNGQMIILAAPREYAVLALGFLGKSKLPTVHNYGESFRAGSSRHLIKHDWAVSIIGRIGAVRVSQPS